MNNHIYLDFKMILILYENKYHNEYHKSFPFIKFIKMSNIK